MPTLSGWEVHISYRQQDSSCFSVINQSLSLYAITIYLFPRPCDVEALRRLDHLQLLLVLLVLYDPGGGEGHDKVVGCSLVEWGGGGWCQDQTGAVRILGVRSSRPRIAIFCHHINVVNNISFTARLVKHPIASFQQFRILLYWRDGGFVWGFQDFIFRQNQSGGCSQFLHKYFVLSFDNFSAFIFYKLVTSGK